MAAMLAVVALAIGFVVPMGAADSLFIASDLVHELTPKEFHGKVMRSHHLWVVDAEALKHGVHGLRVVVVLAV